MKIDKAQNLILILVLFFSSCKQGKNEQVDGKHRFEYHDLFSLKAVNEISNKEKRFPYVTIEEDHSNINIYYYFNEKDSTKANYLKKDSSFYREYEYNIGKEAYLFKEYIKSREIYVLLYDLSSNKELLSISKYSNDKITTFALDTVMSKDLTLEEAIQAIAKVKMYSKREINLSANQDSVYLYDSYQNFKFPELSKDVNYSFNSFNKPLDWWIIFVWQSPNSSVGFLPWKIEDCENYPKLREKE